MGSPSDSRQTRPRLLYRAPRRSVTCAALLLCAALGWAQFGRKAKPSEGPRAIGLVELAANGKAHLVPVALLYEGQFYDAGSYKAAPVPMALESGTVYEGVKSGVSQGFFTVSGAIHANDRNWIGAGTWEAAGTKKPKKEPTQARKTDEDMDKPPVLRRPGSEPAKPTPAPQPAAKAPEPPPQPVPAQKVADSSDDPDRPVLRRGQANQVKSSEQDLKADAKIGPPVQVFPAISDAAGPESHTYLYPTKPEDLQNFRKKMLAMAGAELRNYQNPGQPEKLRKTKAAANLPDFQGVDLKVLDLSTSNEPVLVLSARLSAPKTSSTPDLQYFVTIVAREDIYAELHKVFVKITDNHHLDVYPRFELIDAVDADGDGRGELLFRQISDQGNAFMIYRLIGDKLWPLYEGTPQ